MSKRTSQDSSTWPSTQSVPNRRWSLRMMLASITRSPPHDVVEEMIGVHLAELLLVRVGEVPPGGVREGAGRPARFGGPRGAVVQRMPQNRVVGVRAQQRHVRAAVPQRGDDRVAVGQPAVVAVRKLPRSA